MTLETVDPGGRQWETLGPERALGCVVFPAAEVLAPGVARHEHSPKFPIGEPAGGRSARIETLHRLLTEAGFEESIRDDIRDEIWLKLWGNLCFNPISALTQRTVDAIASDPQMRTGRLLDIPTPTIDVVLALVRQRARSARLQ